MQDKVLDDLRDKIRRERDRAAELVRQLWQRLGTAGEQEASAKELWRILGELEGLENDAAKMGQLKIELDKGGK